MGKNSDILLEQSCPFRQLMTILSEKWIGPILYELAQGVIRPGELGRAIPGVSKKMLTQTLKNLERMELVERIDFEEVPPRVEYILTKQGKKFLEPIMLLENWAIENAGIVKRVSELKSSNSDV